jgi:hypothetical protein
LWVPQDFTPLLQEELLNEVSGPFRGGAILSSTTQCGDILEMAHRGQLEPTIMSEPNM